MKREKQTEREKKIRKRYFTAVDIFCFISFDVRFTILNQSKWVQL